jgi:hypothetical protein
MNARKSTWATPSPLSIGRNRARLGALLVLALGCALALTPSALAARPHVFTSSFGTPCVTAPSEPCTGEALRTPIAVAVGEEAGQVYVLDEGEPGQHGRVVRFSLDGSKVEGEFDGSGLFGEGTAAGGGGREGEIPTGRFEAPTGIAVDNSCALRKLKEPKLPLATCEAEDPSNGDVYVADSGTNHRVIDKYTAGGKYIGQLTEGAGKFSSEGLDGVAVDPSGGVWVYRLGPAVDGFTNASANVFTAETALGQVGHPVGGFARPGIAVDAKGGFYGRLQYGPEVQFLPQVVKWGPTGTVLDEQLGDEEASGVAVDQGSGVTLVDNVTSVSVFNPEDALLERLGQGELSEGTGLGVDTGENSFYAADASGEVLLFGPAPSTVPVVEGESFSGVGSDRASLEAEINPSSVESPEEGQTKYHFEYGRCATLNPASCTESAYEASTPDGVLPPNFSVHPVSAEITGLSPDITYHFRVRARNTHGESTPGKELTFTTEGAGGELVLPDERGWELVSPPDKQGALIEPLAGSGVVQAAADGDGVTYIANAPTEPDPAGFTNLVQVLSRRGVAAWSSRDLSLPQAEATGSSDGLTEDTFFTPALTADVVQPLGPFTPALSEDATESTAYLRDLGESCGAHCFTPLVTGKAGIANAPAGFGEDEGCESTAEHSAKEVCGPRFIGATEDLSHIVLSSPSVALAGGAVPRELFEWAAGALTPVSVLPGPAHEPVEATLGFNNEATRGAISGDGSRIVWQAGVVPNQHLFVRDVGLGVSLQLDVGACGSCESGIGKAQGGPAGFQFSNTEASRVFFTSTHRLTSDSGAVENTNADLYECHVVRVGETLTCTLSDLTPLHGAESAQVQGGVLGASADGSAIYFVAHGVQSEEANTRGQFPVAGHANLYVHRRGGTEFIATLSSEAIGSVAADETDWNETLQGQPTRVSPDGRYIEFMSQAPLTGYDNHDVATGKPAAEVYLYDAETKHLSCASCEPTGARPAAVEYHKLEPGAGGLVGGPRAIWASAGLVAANVPGWTGVANQGHDTRYQPRYLGNEGRLFFDSVDALVPQDSNGTQDVYEYEPPGVGDCSESKSTYSPRSSGCVALISSGRSADESAFLDASESGDDVFFLTSANLSKLDVDSARDVYDAHVCTGSPCITSPSVGSPPCDNESSCKPSPTPQPSIFGPPASATFTGPGNLTAASPATSIPPKKKVVPLTRAQKLSKALRACKQHKSKKTRSTCEKKVRRTYGRSK